MYHFQFPFSSATLYLPTRRCHWSDWPVFSRERTIFSLAFRWGLPNEPPTLGTDWMHRKKSLENVASWCIEFSFALSLKQNREKDQVTKSRGKTQLLWSCWCRDTLTKCLKITCFGFWMWNIFFGSESHRFISCLLERLGCLRLFRVNSSAQTWSPLQNVGFIMNYGSWFAWVVWVVRTFRFVRPHQMQPIAMGHPSNWPWKKLI